MWHTRIGWLLALLILCFQPGPVHAQDRARQTSLLSPSFGMGPDQRATFTLFLSAGEPVRAKVTLHDEGGAIVAESGEEELRAGTFHSFRFGPADIQMTGEEGTGRRQLRASCWIRVSQPWGTIGHVDAVLEITTASTGVTDGTSNTFLIGEKIVRPLDAGAALAASPGVVKDMLVGIAPGQAVRFSVLNAGGTREPVAMHVTVHDETGDVVAASQTRAIPPGHFGWITVDRRDLPVAGEPGTGRAQVRFKPLFAFTAGETGRVLTSLEIVDAAGNTVDGPECLVFFLGGVR
jgi:hypothetical protein